MGLQMNVAIHAKFFNGRMLGVTGNQQHTYAALHLDISITVKTKELGKRILGQNLFGSAHQRLLLLFGKSAENIPIFRKCGTGSFILHMYHLQQKNYSTFLAVCIEDLQKSSEKPKNEQIVKITSFVKRNTNNCKDKIDKKIYNKYALNWKLRR
jgi:hypothetical protein